MDNKKIETINKIYRLTQQDAEFNDALRKKLGVKDQDSNTIVINGNRIDDIYEYCIEGHKKTITGILRRFSSEKHRGNSC